MLKMILPFLVLLSLPALACWKVEGQVSVDGEDYKIHQKVEHDKEYSQPMGTFIFNMTYSQTKTKTKKLQVHYALFEKKGAGLTLITKGVEDLEKDKIKEIYAKGEKNQPHSIITIKLRDL